MRKIAWEKWQDFDPDDLELPDNVSEEGEAEIRRTIIPVMIRTPVGDYSPYEPMNPSKMYDCWVLHTNFKITKAHENVLNQIEGIEVIRVMTRYRIFIGIGKLFDLTEVRPKINMALNIDSKSEIDNILEQIEGYETWAIFIYDDGGYKIIIKDEDIDKYNELYKDLLESGYVSLIKSDDFEKEDDLYDEESV